ncbi:MAG: hypothetical protein C0401_12435 [Anaerolinea sp.]|nr:hypothetical protein [Anaerolinea sp.]
MPRFLTSKQFKLGWSTSLQILTALILLAALVIPSVHAVSAGTIPTISIVSVVTDDKVTIKTYNYPANREFTVRMGEYGTLGVGGIEVAKINSGSGGSFQATFSIPNELKGRYRIAIRLESGIYYSYDFFINDKNGTDPYKPSGSTSTPAPSTTKTPVATSGPGVISGYSGYPTTTVLKVVKNESVTLKTFNFPKNTDFVVRIGEYGTKGVNGTQVTTFNTANNTSFEATYNIPAGLKDRDRLSIRIETINGYYYAYDWFYNATSSSPYSGTGSPGSTIAGYSGIPTTTVLKVVKNESVTLKTFNFPKNTDFVVRIGEYGTKGVGGVQVTTFKTGDSASFEVTYAIPASLKDRERLSIRIETLNGYYYAYDWFYNATSSSPYSGTGSPVVTSTPGSSSSSSYSGIPTFNIVSVVKNDKVTIKTNNFPKDMDFTVRMGAYGSAGVGGTVVATMNSGSGGSFELTYSIPDGLKDSAKIAIRMESSSGYYAYNWFYNN